VCVCVCVCVYVCVYVCVHVIPHDCVASRLPLYRSRIQHFREHGDVHKHPDKLTKPTVDVVIGQQLQFFYHTSDHKQTNMWVHRLEMEEKGEIPSYFYNSRAEHDIDVKSDDRGCFEGKSACEFAFTVKKGNVDKKVDLEIKHSDLKQYVCAMFNGKVLDNLQVVGPPGVRACVCVRACECIS
jgi:hypothetical protein